MVCQPSQAKSLKQDICRLQQPRQEIANAAVSSEINSQVEETSTSLSSSSSTSSSGDEEKVGDIFADQGRQPKLGNDSSSSSSSSDDDETAIPDIEQHQCASANRSSFETKGPSDEAIKRLEAQLLKRSKAIEGALMVNVMKQMKEVRGSWEHRSEVPMRSSLKNRQEPYQWWRQYKELEAQHSRMRPRRTKSPI